MKKIKTTITVEAPVRLVYAQWGKFEEYPLFIPAVQSVHRLDDRHAAFQSRIFGQVLEWEAEIYEKVPERLIAWRSAFGRQHAGTILFEPLDEDRTSMKLVLEVELKGAAERISDMFGAVAACVERNLEQFKDLVERRARPIRGLVQACTVGTG